MEFMPQMLGQYQPVSGKLCFLKLIHSYNSKTDTSLYEIHNIHKHLLIEKFPQLASLLNITLLSDESVVTVPAYLNITPAAMRLMISWAYNQTLLYTDDCISIKAPEFETLVNLYVVAFKIGACQLQNTIVCYVVDNSGPFYDNGKKFLPMLWEATAEISVNEPCALRNWVLDSYAMLHLPVEEYQRQGMPDDYVRMVLERQHALGTGFYRVEKPIVAYFVAPTGAPGGPEKQGQAIKKPILSPVPLWIPPAAPQAAQSVEHTEGQSVVDSKENEKDYVGYFVRNPSEGSNTGTSDKTHGADDTPKATVTAEVAPVDNVSSQENTGGKQDVNLGTNEKLNVADPAEQNESKVGESVQHTGPELPKDRLDTKGKGKEQEVGIILTTQGEASNVGESVEQTGGKTLKANPKIKKDRKKIVEIIVTTPSGGAGKPVNTPSLTSVAPTTKVKAKDNGDLKDATGGDDGISASPTLEVPDSKEDLSEARPKKSYNFDSSAADASATKDGNAKEMPQVATTPQPVKQPGDKTRVVSWADEVDGLGQKDESNTVTPVTLRKDPLSAAASPSTSSQAQPSQFPALGSFSAGPAFSKSKKGAKSTVAVPSNASVLLAQLLPAHANVCPFKLLRMGCPQGKKCKLQGLCLVHATAGGCQKENCPNAHVLGGCKASLEKSGCKQKGKNKDHLKVAVHSGQGSTEEEKRMDWASRGVSLKLLGVHENSKGGDWS